MFRAAGNRSIQLIVRLASKRVCLDARGLEAGKRLANANPSAGNGQGEEAEHMQNARVNYSARRPDGDCRSRRGASAAAQPPGDCCLRCHALNQQFGYRHRRNLVQLLSDMRGQAETMPEGTAGSSRTTESSSTRILFHFLRKEQTISHPYSVTVVPGGIEPGSHFG